MESLLAWLTQYGYAGLFGLLLLGILGLPIPDETLLVFCGYLIYRGRLNFAGAFISGFAGSLCGISLSYYLGLKFGRSVLDRYGKYLRVTPADVDRVSLWYRRIGYWLLTIGYFIPGVRHFTALVAGMSRLEFRTFASFAYPGAAVWVSLFLTLGYVFGERWENTSEMVHRYSIIGVSVLAAIVAIVWIVRFARSKWLRW
ncbi:MAG TPA: DedA family protein [Bryobacteraceae bacterium]|nr:DedA family protein [Bryobacteraceae bacterium]